jgi:uncharacterized protein (TIGR02145 family)
MKTLKLIALAAFALLFSQCKTTAPTGPSAGSASVVEVGQTLDTTEVMFLRFIDSTKGNAGAALQRTAGWLQNQTTIQSVSVLSNTYLYFTLKSGLTGLYYLNEVDTSGMSLSRGGNGGGDPERWDALSLSQIINKSILIFAPVFEEFYTDVELQSELDRISNSGLGLTVSVKKDAECTSDIVDHFGDFGLVILDTHGGPNVFLIGTKVTLPISEEGAKQEIDIDVGKSGYDKFKAGQLMLARGLTYSAPTPATGGQIHVKVQAQALYRVGLTSDYIAGLPKLTGTVIFGNMCFSGQSIQTTPPYLGAQTPIRTAFTNLNPISYYGYSYSSGNAAKVSNPFAKQMEDFFIQQLITNKDNTGHCYLSKDGTEYVDNAGLADGLSTEKLFLKHFGSNDYSYAPPCGDPITDSRGVQKYATVCIGKQQWMAENLKYNAPGSTTYNNDPSYLNYYGRLYDVSSDLSAICPQGWHVPSNSEWLQLFDQFGGIDKAGGPLKSTSTDWNAPNLGASNISGFKGLPGGYETAAAPFAFLGSEALFLSTTLDANGQPLVMILDHNYVQAFMQARPPGAKVSCRCLKN